LGNRERKVTLATGKEKSLMENKKKHFGDFGDLNVVGRLPRNPGDKWGVPATVRALART